MATNSPRSMVRLMFERMAGPPNPLPTFVSSRNAMAAQGSGCFEFALEHAHQTVEHETDESDGDDRQDDVLVNEAVVLLPQETADTGPTREHFGGDNHEPRDTEAEPEPSKHIRHRRRYEDLRE